MPNEKLRLLAVGAHPDDIEFGCGGILLGEAARGVARSRFAFVRLAKQAPMERLASAKKRRGARRSCSSATIEFLDLGGDCHLEISPTNNTAVARQIRRARPDILLAPTSSPDQHPDHIIVSRALPKCGTARALWWIGGGERSRAARDQAAFRIRDYSWRRAA